DKVIVSLNPNSFDKREGVDLNKMFTSPVLVNETALDEFTRLFYVACSRAKNELYIHLEDESLQSVIRSSLENFQEKSGIDINYEFIQ
ncbi:MAG: ATP-dependent helicase, partial [Lactobacillus iners]|nr:ATP-dependent helicase [Lactobacillus iners]